MFTETLGPRQTGLALGPDLRELKIGFLLKQGEPFGSGLLPMFRVLETTGTLCFINPSVASKQLSKQLNKQLFTCQWPALTQAILN